MTRRHLVAALRWLRTLTVRALACTFFVWLIYLLLVVAAAWPVLLQLLVAGLAIAILPELISILIR